MKNTFDFDKWYFIEHDPADHEAKKYYNNSKTNFAVRMKNKSFARRLQGILWQRRQIKSALGILDLQFCLVVTAQSL